MVSKVISTLAVLSVVAVIGVVMYANTDADVADAAPMHGRKALRMDKLHRVKSHAALNAFKPKDEDENSKSCPEGKAAVEVSAIKLSGVALGDGELFWKSKSDPYVTLLLDGSTQETIVQKNAESATFTGTFCFEGKRYVEALKTKGIKVTVMDSDAGDFLAYGDDELASVVVKEAGPFSAKPDKCHIDLTVRIIEGAEPTRKAQLIAPLHTASSLVHPRRP